MTYGQTQEAGQALARRLRGPFQKTKPPVRMDRGFCF
jgi:hypothetical protein